MTQPTKSYFICTTHRTGSNLLCEFLAQTNRLGRPQEYFCDDFLPDFYQRFEVADFGDYLMHGLPQTVTSNGVFGAKIMGAYFPLFINRIKQLPQFQKTEYPTSTMLEALFSQLHYIWLTRRDKVRQAVSLVKAQQNHIWRSDHTIYQQSSKNEVTFDFTTIHEQVHILTLQEAAWQTFFTREGIIPLTVVYEDFCQQPVSTIEAILQYLHLAPPTEMRVSSPKQQKLADAVSEAWVEQYLEKTRVRYFYKKKTSVIQRVFEHAFLQIRSLYKRFKS